MGNLSPGMPPLPFKGGRQDGFADHPTMPVTPVHSLVAIARNGWSRSIGTPGRNQSERAHGRTETANSTTGQRLSATLESSNDVSLRPQAHASFVNSRYHRR